MVVFGSASMLGSIRSAGKSNWFPFVIPTVMTDRDGGPGPDSDFAPGTDPPPSPDPGSDLGSGPEPNDPLGPFSPSRVPAVPADTRTWVAILLALTLLLGTVGWVLTIFL